MKGKKGVIQIIHIALAKKDFLLNKIIFPPQSNNELDKLINLLKIEYFLTAIAYLIHIHIYKIKSKSQ